MHDVQDAGTMPSGPPQEPDRRQLQQIIAGLSEGVVLFDSQGGLVWANPAALLAYGVEAPEDLGASEAEFAGRFRLYYRNRHALRPEQMPVARLLRGRPFDGLVVEVIRAEGEGAKRVHCLRGLILTNAEGRPESLVVVVQDITEQSSAEERFERTFEANPAPALICSLADLRFIKVNHGFLEMTGYERDALIGRSVYEIDVLDAVAGREEAVARLNGWQTIPQSEALLRRADGAKMPVIVAGQPIEMDGSRCMLFTFMDLTPRKQTEDMLRQSEERFAIAFRMAPVPMVLARLRGFEVLDVNAACAAGMGIAVAAALGKSMDTLQRWQDPGRRRQFEQELRHSRSIRNFEARLSLREGRPRDYLISAEAVTIAAQDCVLMVLLDITERMRSETELVAAIEAVMKDTSWFSQVVMEKLANLRQPAGAARNSGLALLTAREREVLGLICKGLSDADIAKTLGLSRNTVRNHVATLYGKIDVHRRSAAIIWARERGITGPQTGGMISD